jgi:hypothetical protein
MKKRGRLEELNVDGMILLKMNAKDVRSGSVYWIHVAQGIDQWRAVCKHSYDFLEF